MADLVGGEPDGVILGPEHDHADVTGWPRRCAEGWRPGDEVVVSRLDHDANVRPWVQAAERAGATVRWAEVELPTGELPAGQYGELIRDRTRLVAVSAASNVIGTRPDVAAITGDGPRGGRAELRGRGARHPARAGRRARARRRLLRDQRVQVVRAAHRRGDRRPGPARGAAPGQARARPGRRAGPVRARHRRRSRTWPGSPPRWTTWPRSPTPAAGPAGTGCWPRWPRSQPARAGPGRGDARRAGRDARQSPPTAQAAPAHRDRLLQRRRAHPAAGRRAPGRPAGSTCGTATTTPGS